MATFDDPEMENASYTVMVGYMLMYAAIYLFSVLKVSRYLSRFNCFSDLFILYQEISGLQ